MVGPAGQPGMSIVHAPPGVTPGITDEERGTIMEMMAKGTYAMILFAIDDLDGTFRRLQARDTEIVQEPTEQSYGVRDCGQPLHRIAPCLPPRSRQPARLSSRRDYRLAARQHTCRRCRC
jgi:hypothetical protein